MFLSPESKIGLILDYRFEITSILGVGSYGTVYLAVDVRTGIFYAIKSLLKVGNVYERIEREVMLHVRVQSHPHIVSIKEILDAPECFYIIMEYCSEGDLFTAITQRNWYYRNDVLIKDVFLQLIDAVEYCHSLGIYHRDLKPENVLVCQSGKFIKLADFGLATTETYTTEFGCGSTFYMSPECLQSNTTSSYYASSPSDVWSLGVILVNLVCRRNPWKQASSLFDKTFHAFLKKTLFLRSILPLSSELELILQSVFDPNPITRMTLADLRTSIMNCERFTAPFGNKDAISFTENRSSYENIIDKPSIYRPLTPASPCQENKITPSTPKRKNIVFGIFNILATPDSSV
ncbi:hypothetical protein PORY_001511 [Pneumocystis oryctolagi]|uniref:Uncharacterized protein n=1 Tax=Pneumocystis oryctolagi TaxID=42067 RepID=A0ACB7CC47_9ASCO|nr:hypothetical protein PORY_001511 [Pneumocystis oryctolagi]